MALVVLIPNALWHGHADLAGWCWRHAALAGAAHADRFYLRLIDPVDLAAALPDTESTHPLKRLLTPTPRGRLTRGEERTSPQAARELVEALALGGVRSDGTAFSLVQRYLEELSFFADESRVFRSHDFGEHLEITLNAFAEESLWKEFKRKGLDPDTHLFRYDR